MAYSKYYSGGWKNNEDGNTPITAAALNHMENGIVSANVIVSTTTAGLMSAQDKSKLNGITAGASVTGIKGNAESSYRSGNVNLTAANIGALPSNTTYVSGVKGNSEITYRSGNVNITPVNIGAVAKSGDTITGRLNINNGSGNGVSIYKDSEGGTILIYATDGHIYEIDAVSGNAIRIHNNQSRSDTGESLHIASWRSDNGLLSVDSLELKTTPLGTNYGGTGAGTTANARENLSVAQRITLSQSDNSYSAIYSKLITNMDANKPTPIFIHQAVVAILTGGSPGSSGSGKINQTLKGIAFKDSNGNISILASGCSSSTQSTMFNILINNVTQSSLSCQAVYRFTGTAVN